MIILKYLLEFLEGVLLKEQENERLAVEMEVKQKQVRTAELETEALKAREVKAVDVQGRCRQDAVGGSRSKRESAVNSKDHRRETV